MDEETPVACVAQGSSVCEIRVLSGQEGAVIMCYYGMGKIFTFKRGPYHQIKQIQLGVKDNIAMKVIYMRAMCYHM